MWAMEQADVHALGGTPRASDVRIVISLLLNSGVVVAMYFINEFSNSIIFGVILAWVLSHNLTFGLGLIRPDRYERSYIFRRGETNSEHRLRFDSHFIRSDGCKLYNISNLQKGTLENHPLL